MNAATLTPVAASLALCLAPLFCWADPPGGPPEKTYTIRPIGRIDKNGDRIHIVLDKKYQPGLLGLEGFSHIYVFWWFDKNDIPEKRGILQVHPRGNPQNPLTGVFATRSPARPNLIALTLCKVVSIEENVVQVEKMDAFPGTPVLDIKPFTPGYDSVPDARVPKWAKPK